MKYSSHLKEIFKDTNLVVEDLLLLESFQIKYLPERIPQKEFATLLRTYPAIHHFLVNKEPTIIPFIEKVLKENKIVSKPEMVKDYCNEVIWEIGELLIYNKFPETYDSKIKFNWEIQEILSPNLIHDKIVADVGAGSGILSLLLSDYSKTVYAIEPLGSFRNYLQNRIQKNSIDNIFIIEGFLNRIPLPDHSLDFVFTSNALGWDFDQEQKEIERVIKPGGKAIHLMRAFDRNAVSPYHSQLLKYNYKLHHFEAKGFKAKYIKKL